MERITDVLYWDYVTNSVGTDSEEVSTRLDKLYAEFKLFQKHGFINAEDREALYDLILQVCDLHRKDGFEAGLKTAHILIFRVADVRVEGSGELADHAGHVLANALLMTTLPMFFAVEP